MLHPGILSSYKAGISKLEKATGVETIKASTKADERKTQATANLFLVDAKNFLANPELSQEVFGPSTVMVSCNSKAELEKIAIELEGHLTATIHGTEKDLEEYKTLLSILETKAGRLIINGFPTGVEVCPSMTHGGPYPSTTDSRTTSVGTGAIKRFVRPVSYQAFPDKFLPLELQAANPLKLWRTVNNELSKD
jgi:NADP-dependent aldehyde dehydrogenase